MLHIDIKYLLLSSNKLQLFKQKDQYSWSFRCPFCGDSKKNPNKTRGNVYSKKSSLLFKCFNCGHSCSIGNLIKYLDVTLYNEYSLERYSSGNNSNNHQPGFLFKRESEVKVELKDSILDSIFCITELPKQHPAVKYIKSRKIPEVNYSKIYFADKFKTWINTLIPGKFLHPENDAPRIVFPYFNSHGKVFAVNARSINGAEPKYIIIKFDENEDTVYGLDIIDYSKHIYIMEGQIDSLFIPNSIAVSGANFINQTTKKLLSNSTHIFDNEPRNKEICKLIKKSVDGNFNVCLLPETFEHKDINDAILAGMTPDDIISVINKNTYSGIRAKLEFSNWKKC